MNQERPLRVAGRHRILTLYPVGRIQVGAETARPGIGPHQEPNPSVRRLTDSRRDHPGARVGLLARRRPGGVIRRPAAGPPTNGRLRPIQETRAAAETQDEEDRQEEGDTHENMMTEMGPRVHAEPRERDRRGLFRGEPER